jgi:hypothetical protein
MLLRTSSMACFRKLGLRQQRRLVAILSSCRPSNTPVQHCGGCQPGPAKVPIRAISSFSPSNPCGCDPRCKQMLREIIQPVEHVNARYDAMPPHFQLYCSGHRRWMVRVSLLRARYISSLLQERSLELVLARQASPSPIIHYRPFVSVCLVRGSCGPPTSSTPSGPSRHFRSWPRPSRSAM